jgi:NADH-quinone oxidoreductase subunit N
MYFKDGQGQAMEVSTAFKGWMVVLAAIIIFLGIFPQWILEKLYF